MMNKYKIIFFTLIFIFGFLPQLVFSQSYPVMPYMGSINSKHPGEIKGFNRNVFDIHFSRADREIIPERWLAEARLGITQAINSWELIAGSLYENPLLLNEAKNQLENWSNEELEERFSQWLKGRFFGNAAEASIMVLSQLLDKIQVNLSWHLDDEGNVLFDDKTGDPMIIRPDDEGRAFALDLIGWQNEADKSIKDANNFFDNILFSQYAELLAYIPGESRGLVQEIISEFSTSMNSVIKREFENFAAREEKKFKSRRTRDIWSLRNKSDNEAARLFTLKLIAETEESCKNGINELTIRIEQAEAGKGDLALLGEEWLQLYKEQFDKGLKAWEEAEERFFIRRIEWEQESFKLFSEGDEIWQKAFEQFEEQRIKWELDAKYLFETGAKLFEKISDDFEKNIKDAKKEFETNMNMRIGEGTTKVKALVDMYIICASAAVSAMENTEFLYNRYNGEKTLKPRDAGFYSWLKEELQKKGDPSLMEIKKVYDMYISYMEKALDARDRILADFAGLLGTGNLKDILSPDASSEDFFPDEYQIALIRAKALVLYWEKKTSIAEAVMSYAEEYSAGRMTESEGLRALEAAKTLYNLSLAEYEMELDYLNSIGNDIQKQREKLDIIAAEMQKKEEKLNQLTSEYNMFLSIFPNSAVAPAPIKVNPVRNSGRIENTRYLLNSLSNCSLNICSISNCSRINCSLKSSIATFKSASSDSRTDFSFGSSASIALDEYVVSAEISPEFNCLNNSLSLTRFSRSLYSSSSAIFHKFSTIMAFAFSASYITCVESLRFCACSSIICAALFCGADSNNCNASSYSLLALSVSSFARLKLSFARFFNVRAEFSNAVNELI